MISFNLNFVSVLRFKRVLVVSMKLHSFIFKITQDYTVIFFKAIKTKPNYNQLKVYLQA